MELSRYIAAAVNMQRAAGPRKYRLESFRQLYTGAPYHGVVLVQIRGAIVNLIPRARRTRTFDTQQFCGVSPGGNRGRPPARVLQVLKVPSLLACYQLRV